MLAPGHPQGPERPVLVQDGGRWRVDSCDAQGVVEDRTARFTVSGRPIARESALRIASSLWLPRAGALLVHAASGVRGSRAALFAGPSGIGKSTLAARLHAQGWDLFGEEIALVSAGPDGAWLHRHPFGHWRPRADRAPLGALFFLDQAPRHRAAPLSPAEACARLLACAMAHEPGPALATAAALAGAVPARRLWLAHDQSAAAYVARMVAA